MNKIYFYPFWLRFWHWLNALLFLVLIASGLSLHFSDPNSSIVSFRIAMVSHNIAGILLSLNYLMFFIQGIISGNLKQYIPKMKGFTKRLMIQLRYYILGIFIGEPHPFHTNKQNKFNPMQQVAYLFIMFLFMPIIIISGYLLMFPEVAPDQLFGMGGVWPMAFAHSITGYFLSIFMLSHIYLATTGNTMTELVKSMVTGWHLEHEDEIQIPEKEILQKPIFKGRKVFPVIFYNPMTMTGAIGAIISFLLIIFLMLVEFFSPDSNPYLGIITFVMLPSVLLFGLLLIAWGAIKENRRLLQMSENIKRLPVIDLNNPKHQVATMVFSIGTILIVVMSIFGSFKAYEYTDSDEFCGQVCHVVMEPEFTAYLDSPHSRVGCVKCHIGSGADWFVRSKLSGTYQVYSVLFNKYSKPIPTPVENLRPAAQTCEQCHWPKHFYSEKKVTKKYFLPDEKNSPYQLTMLIKVGGGSHELGNNEGIHYVMNIANEISYFALDNRKNIIPWVKTISRIDGKERVYRDTSIHFDENLLRNPKNIRVMDCIDCHNRPSHIYNIPAKTLNSYMVNNTLDTSLPYIKRIGMQSLETYATKRETAKEDINRFVVNYYKNYHGDIYVEKKNSIKKAAKLFYQIYLRDYFPDMKVNWKNYPNNIGHMYSPGCFRCHDGKHISNDGRVISNDCNICHLMIYQKLPNEPHEENAEGLVFKHPGGVGKIADTKNCVNCHGAYPKSKDVLNFSKK